MTKEMTKSVQVRKRYGITFKDNDQIKDPRGTLMYAVPTGQMADGSLVWTECTHTKELVNPEQQYLLQTRHGWSVFIAL